MAELASGVVIHLISQVKLSRAVELSDPAFGAMHAVANAADIGVLCFDVDLVIRSLQGSVFARYGWSPELVVGRPLAETLPAGQVELFRAPYEAALRGERASLTLVARDGRGRLEISVEPVRVHGGTIVGGIAVGREAATVKGAQHETQPVRKTFKREDPILAP